VVQTSPDARFGTREAAPRQSHRVSRTRRVRGTLGRARDAVTTMRRYGREGNRAGLMNGVRTLCALGA